MRSACGVTWRDRHTNQELRERCGVEVNVVEAVGRKTLTWFGHMERMTDDRLTKRVYESEVEGVGRRGRPRMRWKDGVNKCLRERGVEWEEGCRMTGSRSNWRRLVHGHPLRE